MKPKNIGIHEPQEIFHRSLILCLALIAIVALNFLYARKAFAAVTETPVVRPNMEPAMEPDQNEMEVEAIDDSVLPPGDSSIDLEGAQAPPNVMPVTEASILAKLHTVNQMEIQMGTMAKDNADADLVKRYGHRLSADHRYVDGRLLSLAKSLEMDPTTFPEVVSSTERQREAAEMAVLASVTGISFDGRFLEKMEQGHRQTIDFLVNGRSQLPADSKVRIFAGQVIPILQQHLDVVSHLQDRKF